MDGQLANLGFALVTKAGVYSLALAVVFYVSWRLGKPHFRSAISLSPKQVKRILIFIWCCVTVIMVFGAFNRNAPKIVLEPPARPAPQYNSEAPLKNHNPATKTDAERVEETREIGRENAYEK